MTPHRCCDGECNHDDCYGKVPENCPEHTTPTDDLVEAQEHLDARKKEIDENLQRTIHPPFMTTPQVVPEWVEEKIEEFDSLYDGVEMDYPVCCTQRDCACNGETVLKNMHHFIRTALLAAHAQGEKAESERVAKTSVADDAHCKDHVPCRFCVIEIQKALTDNH